jgi:hypothetical protein
LQIDALPTQLLSLGNDLNTQVTNPFYGLVGTGTLAQPTVAKGQLLRPFPQYTNLFLGGGYNGNSTYHALQVKAEKRFARGGSLLAAYTFSKLISDVTSLTMWLDSGVSASAGPYAIQDPNNLRAERALSGFDVRQRLTLSYAVDLPFGKGQRLLNGGGPAVQKFSSGWSVSGTSTFQMGLPLPLTASGVPTGPGFTMRPNVVPGCDPKLTGPAQSRLTGWFNVACFKVPAPYSLGNEPAFDPVLRSHGINNFDFALLKKTPITERVNLEFRGEVYNLFNRVRFGLPNVGVTTAANATTGYVTTQINQPRLIQLALRMVF